MKAGQIIQVLVVLLVACNGSTSNKTIEGDYYIKAIDIRFFDLPDTTLAALEKYYKTTSRNLMSASENNEYDYMTFLIEHELLRKPYIRLLLDNGDKTVLFLDKTDYNDVLDLWRNEGDREKMKIRIKAAVDEIQVKTRSVYNARKLISINIIKGKTYYEK